MPQDLYTHLTEVFNRILLHHSGDAYDKFEEISALVKKTDLKFKDPKYDFEVNAEYGAKQVTPEEAWIARSKNLLNEVSYRGPSIGLAASEMSKTADFVEKQ